MFFLKEHLIGATYEWTEKKGTVVRTIPGMKLFDRVNGDQLLYMINFFCTSVGAFTINEGQEVEKLINILPPGVESEIAVYNWLRGKYSHHWKGSII